MWQTKLLAILWWMLQPDFVRFINHFAKFTRSSKENPTLLLLDNRSSHMSVGAINFALEHGITMLTFPPHCSHRLQPLDVSVFGPVKGKSFDITLIPKFVNEALINKRCLHRKHYCRFSSYRNITIQFC